MSNLRQRLDIAHLRTVGRQRDPQFAPAAGDEGDVVVREPPLDVFFVLWTMQHHVELVELDRIIVAQRLESEGRDIVEHGARVVLGGKEAYRGHKRHPLDGRELRQ